MAENVQEKAVNANDAMAYPTAILIAGTQEPGVSIQVNHPALAYCIWWCAGNARLLGCHKTIYHSPAAAVGHWEEARQAGCIKDVRGKACSEGQHMVIVCTRARRAGTAELLCKVRLSTSSWHQAHDVARHKSSMDAQAGCHKGHDKVLHHLTCSTCCCCGSSADEVKGYMQGHRGRAHSKVTTSNAVKCRGSGLFWKSSIMPEPSTTLVLLWYLTRCQMQVLWPILKLKTAAALSPG
jgi:hypothetical protein